MTHILVKIIHNQRGCIMKPRRRRRNRLHRNSFNSITARGSLPEYQKLWILRILWELGGHHEFLNSYGFSDESLAQSLTIGEWVESPDDKTDEIKLNRRRLRELYTTEVDFLDPKVTDKVLTSNVINVAEIAVLNETDCRILEFALLLQCEQSLIAATDYLGDLSLAKAHQVLSVILGIPLDCIKESLKPASTLARTGLVLVNSNGGETLQCKLEVISTTFADLAMSEVMDPVELLRGRLTPATYPELSLKDYEHIDKHLQVLLPYLKHVNKSGRTGVNVLLYGEPGTGKTQLVKALAKEMNVELFEVASEDEDGDSVNGSTRLKTYRAAQSFLTKRRVFLAFEEIEDIFPDNSFSLIFGIKPRQSSVISKAWLNRILEENKVPTFWISNSVSCIDPAYTRRFDYVIEMPVPPRGQRERIIKTVCDDLVPPKSITRLAESEKISPAVIARVASVVSSIKNELPEQTLSDSIEMMVESTLKAQGHKIKINNISKELPDLYDPTYINTKLDLNGFILRLEDSKSCRICIYGPPGTGKTAYGYWLSRQLNMPIVIKRVSDLQSPYIGEAEQNIAAAFEQAELDNSILLIDEVDSFLQDRRGARHSWEVSQVNEFLTQMESFSGIFIATTNLMDGLDQASIRRFDMKTKFGYLIREQVWRMFSKQCKLLSIPIENERLLQERLGRLTILTPGDFAVIARINRFSPIINALHFVEMLEGECEHKDDSRTSIGFI